MAVSYGQTQGFDIPNWTYQNQEPFDIVGAIERGIGLGNLVMDQPNLARGRKVQRMQQEKVLSGELPITQAQTSEAGLVQGTMQDRPSYEAGLAAQQALTQQRQAQAQMAQMEAANFGQPEPLSPVDQARLATEIAREQNIRQQMGLRQAQMEMGMQPQVGMTMQEPQYDEAGNLIEQEESPFVVVEVPETGERVTMIRGPKGRLELYKPPTDAYRQTFERELGKSESKFLQEDAQGASKAYNDLPQLYQLESIIKSGNFDSGLGAELFGNIRRFKQVASDIMAQGKAANKDPMIINNEILDAYFGQQVFPKIGELGIGARGLDTPAERDFILSVFSGKRALTPETLAQLTQIAIKRTERRIQRYNEAVSAGRYGMIEDITGRQMPSYDYGALREQTIQELPETQKPQQTQPATPGGLKNAPPKSGKTKQSGTLPDGRKAVIK